MIRNHLLFEYAIITVGALLMAVSINMFYSPNEMVIGGVTGLAIVLQSLTQHSAFPIPVWLTNLLANIPLFLMGLKVFGLKKLSGTIYATVILTVFLYITNFLPRFVTDDLILVALFGGVLDGAGLGLIFHSMATTGGTDMAASLIHTLSLPYVSISKIMFVIDAAIIAIGFFVFGPIKAMYAIISIFVLVKCTDSVQEGFSFAKAAFIISEDSEGIAQVVMRELERGVTGLLGKGMYTQRDKNVLLCVVSNKEVVKIKELVHQIDPNAFVIVADVREVMGEGFMQIT